MATNHSTEIPIQPCGSLDSTTDSDSENRSTTTRDRGPHGLPRIPVPNADDAFSPYGIDHGATLIKSLHRFLSGNGYRSFSPSPEFARALRQGFEKAWTTHTTFGVLPDALSVALDSAISITVREFLDAQRDDLRNYVLPRFFKRVVQQFLFAILLGFDFRTGIYLVDKP